MTIMGKTVVAAVFLCVLTITSALASTFSFSGTVLDVNKGKTKGGNRKIKGGALVAAASSIDQQNYTNNPTSWIGRPMQWSVHPTTTAAMLHGKFVSPQTFVNALSVGQAGYFYESTWLDLYVTPDYQYGEIYAHDEARKTIVLGVWRANKDYHYPESMEKQLSVTYGDDTAFRVEGEPSDADQVLNRTGGVLQVHPPRRQVILLGTKTGRFAPSKMQLKAGRGQANGRCRNAVLMKVEPGQYTFRTTDGEEVKVPTGKTALVLDGKLSMGGDLVLKPGRHAALAYYRSQDRPHMLFFRTMDDEISGVVKAVDGSTVTVHAVAWDGKESDVKIEIDPSADMYLNGAKGRDAKSVKIGQDIRVFPKRPQTIVALKRRALITDASGRETKVIAEGYLPVGSFRCVQRVVGKRELTFDARSSYAFGGKIKAFEWSFGDGQTATGQVVRHTFTADKYGQFDVELTVTDERGRKHRTRRHVVAAPALMKAVRADTAGLKPGLKLEAWTGLDQRAYFRMKAEGAAIMMKGNPQKTLIIPSFDTSAPEFKKFPRPSANRTTGYVLAPANGWFAVGAYRGSQLWLDDLPILRGDTGAHRLGQRTWVYLAKGLHAIRFESPEEMSKNRFTWMHLDGRRVAPDKAPENITEDAMWRTYRPLGSLVFH